MNELELRGLWDACDKKLEKTLKLNLKIFEDMQTVKAKSKLSSLLSIKVAGIVFGVLWNLFLGGLIYGNHLRNLYFTFSVGMLMLFGIIGIATYIKHAVLISQVDYTGSITDTQSKLAELQLSTIRVTGFLWLQMPFYTTFFWNNDWVMKGDLGFWLIAFPITLLFAALAIWLYKNITPGNLHKKWVKKLLVMGMEYQYVILASGLLQEIEEFKKDAE
jgi:hypothetical protein